MHSTTRGAVAANVRAERGRRQLTQEQLAAAMGWSVRTVQRVEDGDRGVLLDEVPQLCRALRCGLGRLLIDVDAEEMAAMYPPAP